MINFNVPPFTGKEMEYMRQAVENQKSAVMVRSLKNAASG